MSKDNITHLRPVDIEPPLWKDPVTMLRGLIESIEAGEFGDVRTIAIAMRCDATQSSTPLAVFSGGRETDLSQVHFAFHAAQALLFQAFMEGQK